MREYVKPMMDSEVFAANEYFSACGDSGTTYLFTCDAGWTGLTGSTVYTNGPDGVMNTADDVELGSYHKCGKTHYASKTDEFIEGYLRKNVLGAPIGERQEVIIWRGENGDNIHCTTNLDINEWETAKS